MNPSATNAPIELHEAEMPATPMSLVPPATQPFAPSPAPETDDEAGRRTPTAEALKSSFRGVVLVCADCEKRGSGPKKLRAKEVRKAMKDALRPAKGRLRVATTGCLGPCPKKAMTVAALAGGSVSVRAVRRASEVAPMGEEAVAMLGG